MVLDIAFMERLLWWSLHFVNLSVIGSLNHSFEFHYFTKMLAELLRREKHAKIKPDPDIDAYMKVRKKDLTNKC